MSFEKEFDNATKLALKASEKTIKATALQIFGQIIDRTPVDEGRLRGNWQTTLKGPAAGELDVIDKSGNPTKGNMRSVVTKYTLKDSVFLTNNLPYATFIENGTSKIRPYGMVKRTITAVNQELEKNARRFKVK